MVATAVSVPQRSLVIEKEISISAPLEVAFAALLEELGPANESHDGTPMPMVLEAQPGGRWWRDLGHNSGHLWGVVQVIKPPNLLEIYGPLFMSYPCMNHVQYRLTVDGTLTKLKLVHRGFGEISQVHLETVSQGWSHYLHRIKCNAERAPTAIGSAAK